MKRMPNGVKESFFYEKDAPSHTPDWMSRCAVPTSGETSRWGATKHDVINYLMVDDAAGLLFMANLACIEFHPLHSRCATIDQPDYVFFDLDPFEPAGYEEVLSVARMVNVSCERLGLTAYPKTSGATGMQIYVPIEPGHSLRGDPGAGRRARPADARRRPRSRHHGVGGPQADREGVRGPQHEPRGREHLRRMVDAARAGSHGLDAGDVGRGRGGRRPRERLHDPHDLGTDRLGRRPVPPVVDEPYQDLAPALETIGIERVPPRDRRRTARAGAREGSRTTRVEGEETIARSKDPKLRTYLKKRTFGDEGTPGARGRRPVGERELVRHPEARRHPAALRPPARARRRAGLVGRPEGPAVVKGEKHLAVQTEDHPMEYGDVRGHDPEGPLRRRRGSDLGPRHLRPAGVDGHEGQRPAARRALPRESTTWSRRRASDWLVFLAKRSEVSRPDAAPAVTPMMAEAGHEPFDDAGWIFEPKLDGVRTLVYLDDWTDVRLVSRTGRDQTAQYPELHRIFDRVTAENAVLDGEIVAIDEHGQPVVRAAAAADEPGVAVRDRPGPPSRSRSSCSCSTCCGSTART